MKCGGFKENGPNMPIGTGIIKRYDLVGVGVALLEENVTKGWALKSQMLNPHFKLHCRAIVIKQHVGGGTMINGIKLNIQMYVQIPKIHTGENRASPTNGAVSWIVACRRMKIDLYLHPV